MQAELTAAIWTITALLALVSFILFLRALLRNRSERQRLRRSREAGLHIPPSLHPVIDTDVCISSAACVAACPEGDVLGLIDGAGRLVQGTACIGHGRCAAECPVQAIRLAFGTEERGVDIPHVTPDFETNRPGMYIAGELGGMGLIKNAIRQGVGAARHSVARLDRKRTTGHDVVIVGAGPAGIGAALACTEQGASYALVEQDTVGGTVAHYPRHKVVMTEPVDIPLWGRIHRSEMTKEELLEVWGRVMTEAQIEVAEETRCTGIDGEDGSFVVHTDRGDLECQKVILAIGRRGTPRRLGVPGEASPRVVYRLVDPVQYAERDVLVVGGGDSALEAAAALAGEGCARVTLCYRGEGFFRAKEQNRRAVEALAGEGRLRTYLRTTVSRLEEAQAILDEPDGRRAVKAEYVIAALGGELPTKLLGELGIRVDRWFGAPPEGVTAATRVRAGERRSYFAYALFAAGMLLVAGLAWLGREYYPLDAAARKASELHGRLRSSGTRGHGIGVIATLVMLTNFAYAARKRLSVLRGRGATATWLAVHVLVGLLTPAVIAFHAAFEINNLLAAVTYLSLAAVVVTGIVGRWVYGRIHTSPGFGAVALAVGGFKRFLRVWRGIHVVLALAMVVAIVVHVGLSLLLGYRWIF